MKSEEGPDTDPIPGAGGPVSILIVEDEGLVALSISQILSTAGYEIIGIAGSADAAIRTAEDHRPDLVLMDIALRGRIDGIEAARALKDRHDPHVLFLTAHGDAETRLRAEAVGPAGFLIKPYDGKELLNAVKQALAIGD
ncbi:response regulator [Virgifigura deserti]|uniref:response regulator n=1 Tax=Virgifigura deserti TaxID=2268457 RepID=UPI003CCC3F8A